MTDTPPSVASLVRAKIQEVLKGEGRGPVVWPDIPEDLVVFLEELYPPRCLERHQTVEDHLRYAGMVELVADMRHHMEVAKEARSVALDDGELEVEVEPSVL